jgi:hypothetical protein
VFERDVRVLDDAEHIAVRVENDRHPDAVADVLNAVVLCCSEFKEPTKRRVRIVHTPVSDHAGAGGGAPLSSGYNPSSNSPTSKPT